VSVVLALVGFRRSPSPAEPLPARSVVDVQREPVEPVGRRRPPQFRRCLVRRLRRAAALELLAVRRPPRARRATRRAIPQARDIWFAKAEGKLSARAIVQASLEQIAAGYREGHESAAPVLVAPGAEGILGEAGSVVVASLPAGPLDATRAALVERSTVPFLFVHAGRAAWRPGTLTRFSWSLADHVSR
jgi:hypothetical protein